MTADDQNPAGQTGQDRANAARSGAQGEQSGLTGQSGQSGQNSQDEPSRQDAQSPQAEPGPQDAQSPQDEPGPQDAQSPQDEPGPQDAQSPQDEPGPQVAQDRGQARQPAAAPTPLNYHAARRRFMRQVATSQRARRHRFVLIMMGALSLATLLVSCGAWVVTSYISAGLARLDAGTSGTPTSGPVNILVVGIDTRGGLTHRQEVSLHVGNDPGTNTDTMMLVHIPANHESVQVVSLPRDSWVNIPGHGMNKINAAYGIGGPALMVSTVEQATGLDINDYVEVDFVGFVNVINALGGVNVCLPYAVDDSDSGLDLSAGPHHVGGVTALEFARDRHSFAASDLARISDQQQLLSSAFTEATQSGVLANPVRLHEVLASVTASVRVDQGFNLVELADQLRGLKSSDVSFTTVPLATMNYQTPTGESAVLWNQPAAAALFHRLQTDSPQLTQSGTSQGSSPGARTAAQDACH
jgi:LCP family protein required for cell wall assembly